MLTDGGLMETPFETENAPRTRQPVAFDSLDRELPDGFFPELQAMARPVRRLHVAITHHHRFYEEVVKPREVLQDEARRCGPNQVDVEVVDPVGSQGKPPRAVRTLLVAHVWKSCV